MTQFLLVVLLLGIGGRAGLGLILPVGVGSDTVVGSLSCPRWDFL